MPKPIQESVSELHQRYGLVPVMAAEIECYVLHEGVADDFWHPVNDAMKAAGIHVLRIEKERGDKQYEVITYVTTPERLAQWLSKIKSLISDQAVAMGIKASFAAKPFYDQPSSGLHIHLHLADDDGINAYHKTEEWTSDALRWSLGGLIKRMPEDMEIFVPNEASYARFEDIDHVPRGFNWGVNNRYCALRIPSYEDPYDKRIEHRVPGADADPEACIAAMLEGVLEGIDHKIEPPEQEFGKPKTTLLKPAAVH